MVRVRVRVRVIVRVRVSFFGGVTTRGVEHGFEV